mmetsp:Transcript_18368/g.29606  ORF Transcript_18368/g.29606 Transcript_18368/m.29606 type:complete len:260 (+) Transcript_18368:322-1101(+)
MSYIPMVAATSGTLSIKAEANPMTVAIMSRLGKLLLKKTASSFKRPLLSSTPMLIKIPRKNKIPAVSNFAKAAGTLRPSSPSSPMWITSVKVHIAPKPVNMARYGGRPVSSANTGTHKRLAIPLQKTNFPRGANSDGSGSAEFSKDSSSSTWPTKNAREATRHTTEGRKSSVTVGMVESWLLIHSIVVVTSPIGVQTPPALAATTTMAPKSFLSASFGTNFFKSEHMTMVTVKLLRIADRKNVRKPIVQKSDFLDVVLI